MKKIIFVKENYLYGELRQVVVRFRSDFGFGTMIYNPVCVPKYVQKFMEKHNKELFSTEYDQEKFGIITYIYRKNE